MKTTMQPPIDHAAAAKRESRLLIGVAAGLGCLLLFCWIVAGVATLLALTWTLQGQLGRAVAALYRLRRLCWCHSPELLS